MTSHFSMTRRSAVASLITAPWLAHSTVSHAQANWPSKPIRYVVTFSAGGSTSVFARLLAEPIGAILGQNMWVENRPGAGGIIGVDSVVRSPADGYSLVMTAAGPTAIFPAMEGSKLPFDPVKDLTPIVLLSDQPNVFVVHPSVPTHSLQDFIAWCKKNPGEGYGTVGVGTTNHVSGEQLSSAFGLGLTHVPYKGAAAITMDLLGGNIKIASFNIVDAMANITAGKFKPLLVSGSKRSTLLPNTPTMMEVNASPHALNSWQGIFGPPGLSPAIVEKLNAAFNEALKAPAVMEWMKANGSTPVGGSIQKFRDFVLAEQKIWGDMVRRYKIRAE